MASDDFEVVAFKIPSCLYRCMKDSKKADITALRQLVGCNEAYFGAVARSLQSKEYVEGFAIPASLGKRRIATMLSEKWLRCAKYSCSG